VNEINKVINWIKSIPLDDWVKDERVYSKRYIYEWEDKWVVLALRKWNQLNDTYYRYEVHNNDGEILYSFESPRPPEIKELFNDIDNHMKKKETNRLSELRTRFINEVIDEQHA